MRLSNRIINYELSSDYCFDLGRSGTSSFRTRLELPRHSAGSGRHSGLSAEHNCLSSQFDVNPKKKTCFHRGRSLAGTAGNELAELLIRTFVCGIQWKPKSNNGASLYSLLLF